MGIMRRATSRRLFIGAATVMVMSTLVRFIALTQDSAVFLSVMNKVVLVCVGLFALAALVDWDNQNSRR